MGAIAASLSILYFSLLNLLIFAVLEVGLVILMGYGYWKKKEVNVRVEWLIRTAIMLVMAVLTYFVFRGLMTVVEFTASILMLWGTYFLTHRRMFVGWYIYGVAHIFSTMVGVSAEQPFFADFQIASAMVALFGAWQNQDPPPLSAA